MNPKTEAACEIAHSALAAAKAALEAEALTTTADNDASDLIRFYADLREAGEAMREVTAALSKLEQTLSYNTIPTCFDSHGILNQRVDGYGLVALSHRTSCKILDRARGYQFLRDHGQGGLIIQTVNAGSLGAWAGDEIAETGKELPDDIFETKHYRYVSLTRSK